MTSAIITVVYNEGQGFTEVKKEYTSLQEATQKEGTQLQDAHIYKDNTRIF